MYVFLSVFSASVVLLEEENAKRRSYDFSFTQHPRKRLEEECNNQDEEEDRRRTVSKTGLWQQCEAEEEDAETKRTIGTGSAMDCKSSPRHSCYCCSSFSLAASFSRSSTPLQNCSSLLLVRLQDLPDHVKTVLLACLLPGFRDLPHRVEKQHTTATSRS